MPLNDAEKQQVRERLDSMDALRKNLQRYGTRPDLDLSTKNQIDWAASKVRDAHDYIRDTLVAAPTSAPPSFEYDPFPLD